MRIVLCDDHRLLVEAFATALRGYGYDVVATAATPEDGYQAVLEHEPDVCVLDLFFPGGSGLDAAKRITSAKPACKVLILSARSDPDLVLAALAAGASGSFAVSAQARRQSIPSFCVPRSACPSDGRSDPSGFAS